jgi:integrase
MPRPATGSFEPRKLSDGTEAFHLRFTANRERESLVLHEAPTCPCCGGGWDELRARVYLANCLAKVQAGVWVKPTYPAVASSPQVEADGCPPYGEFCGWWLDQKIAGVLGETGPISDNTESDYRWRLGYSEAFFGAKPVDEIDRHMELSFKASLFKRAKEDREAIKAGADLRDHRGRRLFPLSVASIKKIIDTHAAVLDEAVEEGHRSDNPARSKRMRIKVPKPKRTFLEMDELAALLEAASDQDVALPNPSNFDLPSGGTSERVLRLAAAGLRPLQIAQKVSRSKATVTYHLRKLNIEAGRAYVGRRVVCELLGRAGLRASEVCDLRIGRVRIHDPEGARLSVLDAKTEAGERDVNLSPDVAEAVIEHIDRLRRAGQPTGPDDFLVPNARGGRISRQRVGAIVGEAAKLASERLHAKGLQGLVKTTPHTLRRTYISVALLANNFDVKWVMDQVGHADSTMTMDVYAQLQQRAEREHGANVDRLVRKARKQLAGLPSMPGKIAV